MKKVIATGYDLKVYSDENYGLHKADDGYQIQPIPKSAGYKAVNGVEIQDETTHAAGVQLGHGGRFRNASELYEACEDEAGWALAVDALARKLENEMFEEVEIVLSQSQIDEIKAAYPDCQNQNFTTSLVISVRK
jgi:hypothetical protein